MIGDDYLQLRAELEKTLTALIDLARELNAPHETLHTLQSLITSLREPFLFVVVGEVKSGKSSLLNALFGREFCRTDVLPATDKIYIFKYDEQERDVHISDTLTECYRPNLFLRDFNIVDTPGTNTIVTEHQTITEQFLPMADLVLFVFSVTNPWAASAWDFLNLVHKKWLKKVVFVVQQADLRDEREVAAVVDHLAENVQKRLGTSCPIFAVSAKKALRAKTTGEDAAQLFKESNFEALERYINDTVARGETRRGKLQSVCKSARVITNELGDTAESAYGLVKSDIDKLEQLNLSLDERKEQSLRQIGGVLYTLSQSYDRAQKRAEEILREKFSLLQTFKLIFSRGDWQVEFQEQIESKLQDSFRRQIENSLELLEIDLKNVWRELHETLQRDFAAAMQARAHIPDFINERNQLLKRIELTLLEKMSHQQIEKQMTQLFSETARWLRIPAGVAAAGGAAAIVGALANAAIVDVTGVIAGVAAIFGTFVAVTKRSKILAQFREQMTQKREEVLPAIEDHLRHAIDVFYQELHALFQPLQNFAAAQKKVYEPILNRIQELKSQAGAIAAQLDISPDA